MQSQKIYSLLMTMLLLAGTSLAQEPAKREKNRTVAPAATNPVAGSGTSGRLSKWAGIEGTNTYVLGDSNVFEDKFGKIGIGTVTPTSPLTVKGTIETTLGGYKFPDGTVQTTALNSSQVVRSLNGLTGDVQLAAGANITITPAGNTLTIAATGAEEPGRMPYQESKTFTFTGVCALGTCSIEFSAVPAGKRLVIKNISAIFRLSPNVFIEAMYFGHGSSSALQVYVPTTLQGKTGGTSPVDYYMANQSVLAFAGFGTTPTVHVQTSDISGSFSQVITLTGYYVDVP